MKFHAPPPKQLLPNERIVITYNNNNKGTNNVTDINRLWSEDQLNRITRLENLLQQEALQGSRYTRHK
jgi:hypothetical protein